MVKASLDFIVSRSQMEEGMWAGDDILEVLAYYLFQLCRIWVQSLYGLVTTQSLSNALDTWLIWICLK